MSSLEDFDIARGRLSYAAAILHTIDLDGLERLHQRMESPQALIDVEAGLPLRLQQAASEALVREEWACPACGERRTDFLILNEDGDQVACSSCGTTYAIEVRPD